jgi:hypothetical protein
MIATLITFFNSGALLETGTFNIFPYLRFYDQNENTTMTSRRGKELAKHSRNP